jgi:tryptophan-rich sensory protein
VKLKDVLGLVIWVFICLAAGYIGSIFTAPSIPTWYANLNKPSFTPPNWIFGPVWTALFILMGIAAYLVWRKGLQNREVQIALSMFGVQLALNVLWSLFFFGCRQPLCAFVEIILLWAAIAVTIWYFLRISKVAGFLLLPYFFWVSFAAILNFSIWKINL